MQNEPKPRPSMIKTILVIIGYKFKRTINKMRSNLSGNLFSSGSTSEERSATGRRGNGCLIGMVLYFLILAPFLLFPTIAFVEYMDAQYFRPPELTESYWVDRPPPTFEGSKQEWLAESEYDRRNFIQSEYLHPKLTERSIWYVFIHLSDAVRSPSFVIFLGYLITHFSLVLVFLLSGFLQAGSGGVEFEVRQMMLQPVSPFEAYVCTLGEKTVSNLIGWLFFIPFYFGVLWAWGWGWWSLVLAVCLAVVSNFFVTVLNLVMELTWRSLFPSITIQNFRAACTIISVLGMFSFLIVMEPRFGLVDELIYLIRGSGSIFVWFFPAVMLWFVSPDGATLFSFGMIVGQVVVGFIGSVVVINHLASGSLERMKTSSSGNREESEQADDSFSLRSTLGIYKKDILLLVRDKKLLMQIVGVPLILAIFYLFIFDDLITRVLERPLEWSSVAYGYGIYTLFISYSTTLQTEHGKLWFLNTLPVRLSKMLIRKLLVWITWTISTGLLIWFGGVVWRGTIVADDWLGLFWMVAGLGMFGIIGGGMVLLTADPHAADKTNSLSVDVMYFFGTLAGIYGVGMYLSGTWVKMATLVLFGALTGGMYQKIVHYTQYLLDPSAQSERTVELTDGLLTAILFFFLQTVISFGFIWQEFTPVVGVTGGFFLGGVITMAIVLVIFWFYGIQWAESLSVDLPEPFLFELGRTLAVTIALAMFSLMYQAGLRWFVELPGYSAEISGVDLFLVGLIVCVGAPVFEEIIFRGMIFTGLRDLVDWFWAAVGSSLVFAVIHPAISGIPVFLMGLALAWLYERQKTLMGVMIAHSIYNFIVIGTQYYVYTEVSVF